MFKWMKTSRQKQDKNFTNGIANNAKHKHSKQLKQNRNHQTNNNVNSNTAVEDENAKNSGLNNDKPEHSSEPEENNARYSGSATNLNSVKSDSLSKALNHAGNSTSYGFSQGSEKFSPSKSEARTISDREAEEDKKKWLPGSTLSNSRTTTRHQQGDSRSHNESSDNGYQEIDDTHDGSSASTASQSRKEDCDSQQNDPRMKRGR